MFLTYRCPRCEQPNRSEELSVHSELTCSSCGWSRDLNETAFDPAAAPSECLRCGNADLWRQKNFPQWAGFTCVAIGAITSSIAWGYHRPILALGILMGFALLDMILYLTMPDVLVCYRCQSKHHAADVSRHGGFNHELAERYRQERIRLQRSESESQITENLNEHSPLQQG